MANRLYVGNLPFHTTEALLSQHLASAGGVVSVSLVIDRETGRSRGFAFVDMESPAAAQKAIADFDGQDMEGRALRVRIAEDRKPRGGGGGGGGGGFRGDRGDRGDRGGRRGR